jgi:hypothetical protein
LCHDSYVQFRGGLLDLLNRLQRVKDRCSVVAPELEERGAAVERLLESLEDAERSLLRASGAASPAPELKLGCPTFEGSAANDPVF